MKWNTSSAGSPWVRALVALCVGVVLVSGTVVWADGSGGQLPPPTGPRGTGPLVTVIEYALTTMAVL